MAKKIWVPPSGGKHGYWREDPRTAQQKEQPKEKQPSREGEKLGPLTKKADGFYYYNDVKITSNPERAKGYADEIQKHLKGEAKIAVGAKIRIKPTAKSGQTREHKERGIIASVQSIAGNIAKIVDEAGKMYQVNLQELETAKSDEFVTIDFMKADGKMMEIEAAREAPSRNKMSTLNYPVFGMCFPFHVSNDVPNNVWMKDLENKKEFDHSKAYFQWMDLYMTFAAGSLIYVIPSEDSLQDQVYVANCGICLPSHIATKETLILSNFRSEPRVGEEDVTRDFFNTMEYNVIQSPHFFEGEADIKYIKKNLFIGGYGIRTSKETYNWMEENFDMKIIKCKMTNERNYHFDCMLFPVDNDNVLAAVDLFDKKSLKEIEKEVNIIPIEEEYDVLQGATNCVRLGTIIANASGISGMEKTHEDFGRESQRVSNFNKKISKVGYNPVLVNLSEFNKGGAALSCMFLHVNYHDYIAKRK